MARQQPSSSSLFVVILLGSVAGTLAGFVYHLPAGIVCPVGFLLALCVEPNLPEEDPASRWKVSASSALVSLGRIVDVRHALVFTLLGASMVVAALNVHNTIMPEYGTLSSWWWASALGFFLGLSWILHTVEIKNEFPGVKLTQAKEYLPVGCGMVAGGVSAWAAPTGDYIASERQAFFVAGCALILGGFVGYLANVSRAKKQHLTMLTARARWENAARLIGTKTEPPRILDTFTWCGVDVELLQVDPVTQNAGWIKATSMIETGLSLPGRLVFVSAPSVSPDGQIDWQTPSRNRLCALVLPPDFELNPKKWGSEGWDMFLGASLTLAFGVDGYMSANGGGKIDPTKRLYPQRVQPCHKVEKEEAPPTVRERLMEFLPRARATLSEKLSRLREDFQKMEETSQPLTRDVASMAAEIYDLNARVRPRLRDLLVKKDFVDPWLEPVANGSDQGFHHTDSSQDYSWSSTDEPGGDESRHCDAIYAVSVIPDRVSTSSFHDLTFYEDYMGVSVIVDNVLTQMLYVGDGEINPSSARDLAQEFGENNIRFQLDERVRETREWETRWRNVKTVSSVPPAPQWATHKSAHLGSVTLETMGFVTRNGIAPTLFFGGCEADLAASMSACPTLAIVGYPGKNQGTRHPQAIRVIYGDRPLPPDVATWKSDTLIPPPTSGVFLGLQVLVARAFSEAKLARCEIEKVRGLGRLGSPRQTWLVDLVLYEGVSVSDVQAKIAKISNVFQTAWVSVHPSRPGRLQLVVGAHVSQVKLARSADTDLVANILWQATFTACKVASSLSGEMPEIISAKPLESNEAITRTVFRLPSGLSRENIEAKTEALAVSAGLAFLTWESDRGDARNLVCLSSPENPLPDVVPYDFSWADAHSDVVGLGVGVDGQTIAWNPQIDPHLLLVGTSGSGKSAAVQGLIYGCLANGWDVIVADPNKRGVDFQPFEPWLSGFVTQPQREGGRAWVAAMLEAVYSEVERRVALNARYSATTFMEIPLDERPRRLVVVLDEFNSLIKTQKPTKPAFNDPQSMEAYAHAQADYISVATIGKYAADIAAQARSAGVSLVLMGQQLKASDLDAVPDANGLRTNLSRVLLGNSTYGDKQGALRSPENAPRLGDYIPKGRGLFEPTSQSRASIIQFYYSNPPKEVYPHELISRHEPGHQTLIEYTVSEEALNPVTEGQIVSDVVDYGVLDVDLDCDLGFAGEETSENTGQPVLEESSEQNMTQVDDSESVSQPASRNYDADWDDFLN